MSRIDHISDSCVELNDLKITPVNINLIKGKQFGKLNDPQYTITRKGSKKLPANIVLGFKFTSTVKDQFMLYFDFGEGFTELSCVSLGELIDKDNLLRIQLPQSCFQIRIDPLASNDEFTLEEIRLFKDVY